MNYQERKYKILIDLDGVLNNYNGNYNENYIPKIKDGAVDFLKNLSKNFKLLIFTSRNTKLVNDWILENNINQYIENVTNIKELCFLIIDDRCITFNGNYEELEN